MPGFITTRGRAFSCRSMLAIELKRVSKSFGNIAALRGVDLAAECGQVVGCVGPNGAGKTTTARLVLGLLRPTSGRVRVFGHDPWPETSPSRWKVGALLEHPSAYEDLSVRHNLELYARIYALSNARHRITALLDQMSLRELENRRAGTLSTLMPNVFCPTCRRASIPARP